MLEFTFFILIILIGIFLFCVINEFVYMNDSTYESNEKSILILFTCILVMSTILWGVWFKNNGYYSKIIIKHKEVKIVNQLNDIKFNKPHKVITIIKGKKLSLLDECEIFVEEIDSNEVLNYFKEDAEVK